MKAFKQTSSYSSLARDIIFEQNGLPSDVGDTRPIGSPNINQTSRGSKTNNVQAAIEDLYSLTIDPLKIGSIYISTDGSSPQAIKHVETLTFEGDFIQIVSDFNDKYVVLGYEFDFKSGTTLEQVMTELYEFFNEMKTRGELIYDVKRKGNAGNLLELTFIDSVPKDFYVNYSNNGISYTSETEVNGVPGYGSWLKIGEEEKFEQTFYYFKRTA